MFFGVSCVSENTAKSAEDAAKSGDISSTLAELDRTLTETAQPAFDFQLDIDLNAMRYSMKPKLDGIKAAGDYRAAEEIYLREVVAEADRPEFHRVFSPDALLEADGEPVSLRFRVKRGGGEIWLRGTVFTSRIGEERHVCAVFRNVDSRSLTESWARQEEIVSLIGSNFLCAATISLSDWRVHFIKRPAVFGSGVPESVSFDYAKDIYLSLLPGDDKIDQLIDEFDQERILSEIEQRGYYEVETQGTADGKAQWSVWRMVKLPSDPDTLLIRQQDITADKEAESARREAEVERQANRSKSVFLANVSHEIRTPLNAILGYAELLLTGKPLPPDVESDVRRISDAGATLLEIVNNILDLSKVESGQFVVRDDLYETRKLVDELSGSTITRIKDKPINFSAECADDLPEYLYGDAVLVKQIIMNLLSNASKYTDKGFITMRMLYQEGDLIVSVTDTGMGIRQEDQERIFNKFERLEANIDHSIEGTGLGLSLTKQLAEQMGGSISVESVFGSGSTFTVTIPQGLGAPPTEAKAAEGQTITAPGIRVLLVDDNSVNLTVAERLLRRFELTVDTAASGEDCLELLNDNTYDCVLLDHMMPVMDGVETLRRIRKMPQCQGLLVIALTANAMKGMREFFMDSGFDDYMPKPISLESIASMLRKWVPAERIVTKEPEVKEEEQFPEALSSCADIDIDDAMQYSESYSDLLSIICDFAGLIETKSAQIEAYARDGDVNGYTVEVHALKSSSRLIGATKLSDLAARLERCGHENDLDAIRRMTPQLLSQYRAYSEKLRPAVEARAGGVKNVEISAASLSEELAKLRLMLKDFDLDGAEVWSDNAAGYKLEGTLAEKMKLLRTSIQMIDYLGAIKLVDEMQEMLKSRS
jgi:signal transduction histidine kinase/CheY-like chemotaxis protein/HPt (histidine-containing phosphotransfer) domain-containing protein